LNRKPKIRIRNLANRFAATRCKTHFASRRKGRQPETKPKALTENAGGAKIFLKSVDTQILDA